MTDDLYLRDRLKQLRGAWGWIFTGLWLVFWWLRLDGEKRAALAKGCPENIMNKMSDMVIGAGESCKASINGNFWMGMLFFIALSPLAFVIAHHFAKWRLGQMQADEAAASAQQEQARQQAHTAAIAQMGDKSRQDEAVARKSSDRYELITRLGAVDDQLIVLADETDTERVKLIKLNLAQSLRDIHAKFTDAELQTLLGQDEGIAARVERTLSEMRKLKLEDSRLYADLATMFAPAGVPHAQSL